MILIDWKMPDMDSETARCIRAIVGPEGYDHHRDSAKWKRHRTQAKASRCQSSDERSMFKSS